MKLLSTEVKFYPEMKSQTGLSLLRVNVLIELELDLWENDSRKYD